MVGIGGVCRTVGFSSGLAGFCPAVSCAGDVVGWESLLSSGIVGVGRKSVLCSSCWDVEGYKVKMYHKVASLKGTWFHCLWSIICDSNIFVTLDVILENIPSSII